MENQNMSDQSKPNQSEHPVLDDHNQVFTEETATEITDDDMLLEDRDKSDPDVTNVYGWIALALSVISFFLIPLLFAGAGIILGFIARGREAPILGNTAIIIGIASIVIRLFVLPLI